MCCRSLTCLGIVLLSSVIVLVSQEARSPSPEGAQQTEIADKGFKIKIGVEEVRLDTVVLDKNGRQITDLTAEDFEIYQDYFRQKVTSCVYINDYKPRPKKTVSSTKDSMEKPPLPVPMPKREDVRRAIVFVVDNLTMDFTEVYRARMALKKFVESQMQEGDLIAIVPTAGGNAAFQTFTADQRQLFSMIDNVRWYIDVRIAPITPQMMAMAYSIRTLRDMPGRKALIMVSPATMLPSPLPKRIGAGTSGLSRAAAYTEASFNPLADAALRAGVVIHTLDIRGLRQTGYGIDAAQGFDPSVVDSSTGEVDTLEMAKKYSDIVAERDSETRIPLSKKTGGLFLQDFNWFVDGIGSVQEELKGYYMLTYTPPPNTFRPEFRNIYHPIRVKAKRPGSEVHTRDGFYGVPEPENAPAGISSSLYTAIFSPFQYNDLKVNLASGYIDDPQKGYLLQSSMHLSAQDLSIVKDAGGKQRISIEAASVTTDIHNDIKDSNARRYDFEVAEENIPWIKEHGIKFSLKYPVKKPGAYYVRTAVRDPASGKMGSAYQYIEIPDLRKSRLSLSNIFIINRDEDLPWVESQAPEEFRKLLYPDLRRDPRRSPALRSYFPGENLDCMILVYNAKLEKGQKPDLESQFLLYANGRALYKSNPAPVDLSKVSDFKRIPISIHFRLGDSIPPGDYVLLLQVKDKLADSKHNLASQALDFKALAKPAAAVSSRE